MNKLFMVLLLTLHTQVYAQYTFRSTMDQATLENYLDRAISMQGLSDIAGPGVLSEAERMNSVKMIQDIGAKFVGRIGGWWDNTGTGQDALDQYFDRIALNIRDIKAHDPEVICQGAIFEHVSRTVGSFTIPDHVFSEFDLSVEVRNFVYEKMLYPPPSDQYRVHGNAMSENDRTGIPDITQTETQLWFYYLATRFIDAGCEAIHFGQAEIMNRRDVGNKAWWDLLSRIRKYASVRNRGIVLCDAQGLYYEPGLNIDLAEWQFYTPVHDINKQLLFDFHSSPTGFTEAADCTPFVQPGVIDLQHDRFLYRRSIGGQHPLGWICYNNPFLVEFDNGGVAKVVGCDYDPSEYWTMWGWDEISWFASQPERYRNQVLEYAWYRVKNLDPNAHLQMPGMRGVTPGNGNPSYFYRANNGVHNQQETIKKIWFR